MHDRCTITPALAVELDAIMCVFMVKSEENVQLNAQGDAGAFRARQHAEHGLKCMQVMCFSSYECIVDIACFWLKGSSAPVACELGAHAARSGLTKAVAGTSSDVSASQAHQR